MAAKFSYSEVYYNKNRIMAFLLNNSGKYTGEEIKQIFKISLRTLQNYISEYNKMGLNIKRINGKYTVISYPKNFLAVKKVIASEDIKKYILYALLKDFKGKNNGIDKKAFLQSIAAREVFMTSSQAYIRKLLKELEMEGYICSKRGVIEFISNPLDLLDDKELLTLLIYLNIMKNLYPRSYILHNVFTKLKFKYEKSGYKFNKAAIVYPHKNKISFYDENILSQIEKAIWKDKKISFLYKTDKSYTLVNNIVPTAIIYNPWKDLWYVIDDENLHSVFRLDRIINIRLEKDSYEAKNFNKDIYQNSFGISNEPLVDIEIKFEKEDFILRKLKFYNKEREGIIIEKDNCYILKDKVCGVLEIEKWIKSFGNSAECIKPIKLREKIKEDMRIALERYGVL